MKPVQRVAKISTFVEAENGDRQDLYAGKTYLTSGVHDDGTVTVFSTFWVRFPVEVFEPLANEKR